MSGNHLPLLFMQVSIYTLSLVFSALICGILSVYILKYKFCRASHEFVFLLVAMSWWAAMNAMETLVPGLDMKVFFSVLTYPGSQLVPVLYLLFALRFTQRDGFLTVRRKALLFLLPAVSILMAVTNGYHHLLWEDISLTESAFAGWYAIYTHGPWYWVEVLYSYSLLAIGIAVLLISSFRSPVLNMLQCRWILLASLIPLGGNIMYAAFFPGVTGIDPTPFLFSIGGFFIAIGMCRFRFLDLVPIAREQVLESLRDGVIVIDRMNRIIDVTPSAVRLLGFPGTLLGRPVADILTRWKSESAFPGEESGLLALREMDAPVRWLSWSCSEIVERKRFVGHCILLRDITRQHDLEDQIQGQGVHLGEMTRALSSAHTRLQLLASVTRHDILNLISVQRGYMELARDTGTQESYQMAVDRSHEAAVKMQELIAFSREYEEIGMNQATWVSLAGMIKKVTRLFQKEQLRIDCDIGDDVEVFLDPLFEKVIFILIDNTIRHGQGAERIRISARAGDEFLMVYEDDGQGIAGSEKERIFLRGIGKNTGFGLFLAREILLIDGCSIREEGTFGKGARFIIRIPTGSWRMSDHDHQGCPVSGS